MLGEEGHSTLDMAQQINIKTGRSLVSEQGGGDCGVGESAEEPQFLRPRRAKEYGRGSSDPHGLFVSYLF